MIRFVHGLELDGFAARCRWKPASYRIRVDVLWPACHRVYLTGEELRCAQEEVVHRVRKIPRDVYVGTGGEAAMKTLRLEGKDFFNCWKALSHSERVFKEAILNKEFPNGSSEDEMLGWLAEIQATKEKIEHIFSKENQVEVH